MLNLSLVLFFVTKKFLLLGLERFADLCNSPCFLVAFLYEAELQEALLIWQLRVGQASLCELLQRAIDTCALACQKYHYFSRCSTLKLI